MSEIAVLSDFERFCNNLRMSNNTVNTVRSRYQQITKSINLDYWDSTSETNHSLYVGSYGRGTSIYTSDIDIIVDLPWTDFKRFDEYTWNGQSSLLSNVRECLKKTYSTSSVSADGQVVDISFSDGVTFEIVPSFKLSDDLGYYYPDTNNGGSWRSMNPKVEMDCFNAWNNRTNGNLKRLCRMARAWKANKTVLMSGILIDSMAYDFMAGYEYAEESYTYYDWLSRDFFKFIVDNTYRRYWNTPGDVWQVENEYQQSVKKDAQFAYYKALEALDDYRKGYSYCWHNEWREIYGTRFPES